MINKSLLRGTAAKERYERRRTIATASWVKLRPQQQQCRSSIRLCCHKRQQSRTSVVKFRPFDKVETNWTCSMLLRHCYWYGRGLRKLPSAARHASIWSSEGRNISKCIESRHLQRQAVDSTVCRLQSVCCTKIAMIFNRTTRKWA